MNCPICDAWAPDDTETGAPADPCPACQSKLEASDRQFREEQFRDEQQKKPIMGDIEALRQFVAALQAMPPATRTAHLHWLVAVYLRDDLQHQVNADRLRLDYDVLRRELVDYERLIGNLQDELAILRKSLA